MKISQCLKSILIAAVVVGTSKCSSCPQSSCRKRLETELGGTKTLSLADQQIESRTRYKQAQRIEKYTEECGCFLERNLQIKSYFQTINQKQLDKNLSNFHSLLKNESCNKSMCKQAINEHFDLDGNWLADLNQYLAQKVKHYGNYKTGTLLLKYKESCGCFLADNIDLREAIEALPKGEIAKKLESYAKGHPRVIAAVKNKYSGKLCSKNSCKNIIQKTKADIFKIFENKQKLFKCPPQSNYYNRYRGSLVTMGCAISFKKEPRIGTNENQLNWHGLTRTYYTNGIRLFLENSTQFRNGKKHGRAIDWRSYKGKPRKQKTYSFKNGLLDGKVVFHDFENNTTEVYYHHPNRGTDRLSALEYQRAQFMSPFAIDLQQCFSTHPKYCLITGEKLAQQGYFFEAATVFSTGCLMKHKQSCQAEKKALSQDRQAINLLKTSSREKKKQIEGRRKSKSCRKESKKIRFCKIQNVLTRIGSTLEKNRRLIENSDKNFQKQIAALKVAYESYRLELDTMRNETYFDPRIACESFLDHISRKARACSTPGKSFNQSH